MSENNRATAIRLKLKAAGFSPIPVTGKRPTMIGWQTKLSVTDDEIARWDAEHRTCRNTGILTKLTPTIDIDILHPEASAAVEALLRERFASGCGKLMRRTGLAPKRAFVFKTDAPFAKLSAVFRRLTAATTRSRSSATASRSSSPASTPTPASPTRGTAASRGTWRGRSCLSSPRPRLAHSSPTLPRY